jgi:CTP synthase
MARYIFVTGGVVSSLGKGLTTAALGALLQARGFRVRLRKFDPYLNVDPGTMSPYQHGEVYVTDDGAETDLDLGHYERFTGVPARRTDTVTSGKVYSDVIAHERRGDYLGGTVQVIPHVTDAIKSYVQADTDDADFVLCEIGGTIGDIESLPFLEAIRQFAQELPHRHAIFIHHTLVPYLKAAGELKTKPTQHSVKEMRSIGLQPDILVCRSEQPLPDSERRKIAQFCNVPFSAVIPALDVDTIYQVPISYHDAGLDREVLQAFGITDQRGPDLSSWRRIVNDVRQPDGEVSIAIVGKYTGLKDAYKSLSEALTHGGIANRVEVKLNWIDSEIFEREDAVTRLEEVDGILVPGGFGERGAEGKIAAATFARQHKVPYFGICFGMQMAVIDAARNLVGLEGASSTEFGACEHAVVGLLTEWTRGNRIERRNVDDDMGGTMRLGAYDCDLVAGTKVADIYETERISERHRHRYEVNINYRKQLEDKGVVFAGLSPDGALPEIIELADHPWFVGVQFHPELKSKPFAPHPLFASFVSAAVEQSRLV